MKLDLSKAFCNELNKTGDSVFRMLGFNSHVG